MNKTETHQRGNWSRAIHLQVESEPTTTDPATQLLLNCDAQTFDMVQIGQTVEVRRVDWGRIFKFARLTNRSTFSFFKELFPDHPQGPWREAVATVRQVQYGTFTEYHYDGNHSKLRWPYDVVELSFVPLGRTQPVGVVDAIESDSAPGLVEGGQVKILWTEAVPRAARVAGRRPAAPWATGFMRWAVLL